MKPFNPTIYEKQYPHTETPYWLVKCELPGASKPYQRKHSTLLGAERDRVRLIREVGGGGLSADQAKAHEVAQYLLQNCTGDASGHSITSAVEYFIKTYKDPTKTPLVEEAVTEFKKEHTCTLRADSQEEYNRYLNRLVEGFGALRLSHLTATVLREHVNAYPSKLHHRKCLVGFFSYCSGGSKKIKSERNWLTGNPAIFIKVKEEPKSGNAVILTIAEVKKALLEAIRFGDLPYWVWGLFTGMRPEEIKRFWTLERHGWNKINWSKGVIEVEAEITKDKRYREIIIRPNLRLWLEYFKASNTRMFPACHRLKFRRVKKAAIAVDKFHIKDLLRHTFISYRVNAFDKNVAYVAKESGNSVEVILESYLELITDESAITKFWSLVPKSFGLSLKGITVRQKSGRIVGRSSRVPLGEQGR
jgi:integrase